MARTQWIFALAKGIRERSTDFRFDTFASQFLPVPPPEEQAAIVRFLDHADRRIRRYIRAKRQLIALLNEQKQAIIHRAVTRGLVPSVDAVSAALRNLPTTHIEGLPRMADFALWATAAESGFGLQSGEFLTVYRGNRDTANETALESSPVAKYVLNVAGASEWSGTSGELLERIETMASDGEKRLKVWPKNPRSLSGILKRLAPNLRAAGVEIEFGSEGRGNQKRRNVSIRKSTDSCVPCAPSVPNQEKAAFCGDGGDASGLSGDAKQPGGDAGGTQTTADVNPSGATVGTQGDGGDAKLRPHSEKVRLTI
jgi:hypothetical protein